MTSPAPAEADPAAGQGKQRREMAGVLAAAALAGLVILFGSGRSWLEVIVGRRPPFGPLRVELTGRAQYPALTGLAVVALLGVVLVLVTGGLVRRALGVLEMLAGGWAAVCAGGGIARPGTLRLEELLGDRLAQSSGTFELHHHPQWAVLTLLAALLLVLAGLAVVLRAGHWRLGLSARYAAPAASAEAGDPWRRLDRGEDPTVADD
ncbi:Trp biosynthesis-associated membrane protein [Jatrophihabitans sp.]|uniref:Trp biosynthesis-associated membrane protein n=1 Tax=Jatrophihabitans sp. TaxID=1932789 RepID=UPI002C1CAE3B|nr:Trp biosynthesis-associated membrane protein [Jatrophihabitans sp.]